MTEPKADIPQEWVEKAREAYAQAVAQTEREPVQAALSAVIPLIRGADENIERAMLRLSEEKTAALTAERDRYREALETLAAYIKRMQYRCEKYLQDDAPDRDARFAHDMVWMLDGPEQREAEEPARQALKGDT